MNKKIYLIGGVARSGKSKLRKLLLVKNNVSGIGTDAIRYMLMKSTPELGLSYESLPEVNGQIMWPYIDALIEEYMKNTNENFVIEGDVLLPKFLKKYAGNNEVMTCFLGFSEANSSQKANDIRNNADEDDWTNEYDVKGLEDLAKWGIEQSIKYKLECEELGIKYYELGKDFDSSLEAIALDISSKS